METSATTARCVFCTLADSPHVVGENATCYAIPDLHAVAEGHLLIIPRRHTPDYFGMTAAEKRDADALIALLRTRLLSGDPGIIGFNVGMNCGEAAGQTIFHAHIHLIPRRAGDCAAPRGGVRGVIPHRMGY